MSELRVELLKVDSVEKVPGADTLFSYGVKGWISIAKGVPTIGSLNFNESMESQITGWTPKYSPGDVLIYLPTDCLLSEKLEKHLFPPDSLITLNKHRIRTLKIRKSVSQGILVDPLEIIHLFPALKGKKEGDDVASILGVTKYSPPLKVQRGGGKNQVSKKKKHPLFSEYTSIENIKWYSDLFEEGVNIVLTEKLHGSNGRASLLPTHAHSLWEKILKFFNLLPAFTFLYGSHHVQLQNHHKGYYGGDIWKPVIDKYDLKNKIKENEILYFEIIGEKVQSGYHYGFHGEELGMAAFDMKIEGKYVDHAILEQICKERGIILVPILYKGPYYKGVIEEHTKGDSKLGGQKCREGCVIRPAKEQHCYMGRKIVKSISTEYLIRNQDNETEHDLVEGSIEDLI